MANFVLLWIWSNVWIDFMEAIIQVILDYGFSNFVLHSTFLFPDWACGGQWNRALQFVQLLVNAFTSAQIEIIAFFDGTLKENKKTYYERNDFRQKTISVKCLHISFDH